MAKICQRDCHCPQNAVSLELFVAFWHLQHVSKRQRKWIRQKLLSWEKTKVDQEKLGTIENSEDRKRRKRAGKRRKRAGKGGKTAEKDGLWTLRSKSCRKHAQKVVSRILSLLVFFLPWNFVESCNPSDSMSMKANASNVQLWTHIYCIYCIYSRACFLHCFSCSVHYIGKS